MNNPFDEIQQRLNTIENLILDLRHQPNQVEPTNKEMLLNIEEAAVFLN
jgi:hypothetical protein